MNRLFDVAIIGGGPAGSAAGSLLAKMGRCVVILEKEKFPRFRVGESRLPRSLDSLERIGVKEKFDHAGFVVKYGGEIVSACGDKTVRYYFRNGRKAKRQTAYQVLRSKFDHILLEHARESGCEVRQETRVDAVEFGQEAVTLIQEDQTRVRAKYIIDCSGRSNLIGSRYRLRQPISNLKKYSVFAYYEDVDRPDGEEGTLTRMIRAKDLWIWMIPLSEGLTSIGIVMDVEKFRAMQLRPEAALDVCLKNQPTAAKWMARAKRTTQVYATGEFSYRNSRLTGDRWLLAGDAAGFIDPVFSSGVYLALFSGEAAADALNQVLDRSPGKEKVFSKYERRVNAVLDLYLRWASAWYTQEFIEVFLFPKQFLEIVPAVSAVLSGNEGREFGIKWRLWIFNLLVTLQAHTSAIAPRLSLVPK